MQFSSDVGSNFLGLNGLPVSDGNISLSPASDGICDPFLVEREIASQNLLTESNANHGLIEGTISYEVAMERELDYQKRRSEALLQPSRLSSGPSQLPSERCLKRKIISEIQPEHVPHGNSSSQRFSSSVQLDQGFKCRQPFQEDWQHQPPLCRSPRAPHVLPQQSNIQSPTQNRKPLYWCNSCQMNFQHPWGLKQHFQSETHLAKRFNFANKNTVPNGKKVLRCKECNVPCSDEVAMAQHRAGKKHAARVIFLRKYGNSTAAGE